MPLRDKLAVEQVFGDSKLLRGRHFVVLDGHAPEGPVELPDENHVHFAPRGVLDNTALCRGDEEMEAHRLSS